MLLFAVLPLYFQTCKVVVEHGKPTVMWIQRSGVYGAHHCLSQQRHEQQMCDISVFGKLSLEDVC